VSLSSISTRLFFGGGAAAALLSAALVAGPGLATRVAADDTSSFPLFAVNSTSTNGVVTLAPDASSTVVTVSLQRALPDATYAVTGCMIDPNADTTNCSAGITGTIVTDVNGEGSATLTVSGDVSTIDVTNDASPFDSYVATIDAGAANAVSLPTMSSVATPGTDEPAMPIETAPDLPGFGNNP
jgi:hypothetical protein